MRASALRRSHGAKSLLAATALLALAGCPPLLSDFQIAGTGSDDGGGEGGHDAAASDETGSETGGSDATLADTAALTTVDSASPGLGRRDGREGDRGRRRRLVGLRVDWIAVLRGEPLPDERYLCRGKLYHVQAPWWRLHDQCSVLLA